MTDAKTALAVVGAVLFVLVCVVLVACATAPLVLGPRGGRGEPQTYPEPPNPYGAWLDRECLLSTGEGTSVRCVVVAVGHKGSVQLRGKASRRYSVWVPASKVPELVTWCDEEVAR